MIAYCKRCGTSFAVETRSIGAEFFSMRTGRPVGHCPGCDAMLTLATVDIEEKKRAGRNRRSRANARAL